MKLLSYDGKPATGQHLSSQNLSVKMQQQPKILFKPGLLKPLLQQLDHEGADSNRNRNRNSQIYMDRTSL